MEEQHLKNREAIDKLISLAEEVKVCMFATVHDDYAVQSRPMQTIKVDEEGNVWFFTNEYSEKADDISKNNTVYLMYSHPGKNTYLHVKGEAAIVNDRKKMEELYSPMIKGWFPDGLEDPALALLKVETSQASYWDGSSNKLVVFYNIVKAIAKGEVADEGEYGKLQLE